jgi:hypothetical protein
MNDENSVEQRLTTQRQSIADDLAQTNAAVRNTAQQFMALQQHGLQYTNRAHADHGTIAAPAVDIQKNNYKVDKFVQGSLRYSRRMIAAQMIQQTALDLAAEDCPDRAAVIAYADQWTAHALKPSTLKPGDGPVMHLSTLARESWQHTVATYAMCSAPYVFNNSQDMTPQARVGCLASDLHRLKAFIR